MSLTFHSPKCLRGRQCRRECAPGPSGIPVLVGQPGRPWWRWCWQQGPGGLQRQECTGSAPDVTLRRAPGGEELWEDGSARSAEHGTRQKKTCHSRRCPRGRLGGSAQVAVARAGGETRFGPCFNSRRLKAEGMWEGEGGTRPWGLSRLQKGEGAIRGEVASAMGRR